MATSNAAATPTHDQTAEPLDGSTKKRLAVIAVIAVLVIIGVAIAASVVAWENANDDDGYYYHGSYYGYGVDVDYDGDVNYFCGTRYDCNRNLSASTATPVVSYSSCFENLNDTNCAYLCGTESWDTYDVDQAFYLPDSEQCYCFTWTESYRIRSSYYSDTWDTYCANVTDSEEVEHYYVYSWESISAYR